MAVEGKTEKRGSKKKCCSGNLRFYFQPRLIMYSVPSVCRRNQFLLAKYLKN